MIAILLALLVAGCSSGDEGLRTATAPGPGARIVVPDVVGLNPAQARTRLCAAGLSVGVGQDRRAHPRGERVCR